MDININQNQLHSRDQIYMQEKIIRMKINQKQSPRPERKEITIGRMAKEDQELTQEANQTEYLAASPTRQGQCPDDIHRYTRI